MVSAPKLNSTAKRHTKRHSRTILQGVTKPAIRRMARRGGVKRMEYGVVEETRGLLKQHLEDVIRRAVTLVEHSKRKTVLEKDVVTALKIGGQPYYGS